MNTPKELKYAKTHEWTKQLEDGTWLVGITDYAQDKLGSLVYINLPSVDDELTIGEAFCDVESVKADSDINAPMSGVIVEINEELADAPEKLNEDPYGAWICRVEASALDEGLMDAEAYIDFCAEEDS